MICLHTEPSNKIALHTSPFELESGDYLQVKNLCLEHNHDLSRVSLMMEAMLFIWSQLCLHCTFVGTIQASTSTTATLCSREGKGGCSIRYESE